MVQKLRGHVGVALGGRVGGCSGWEWRRGPRPGHCMSGSDSDRSEIDRNMAVVTWAFRKVKGISLAEPEGAVQCGERRRIAGSAAVQVRVSCVRSGG